MNIKYTIFALLTISNSINAEFNLIQVDENPNFLEIGYRNTLRGKYVNIITGENYNASFNNFKVQKNDYNLSFYAIQKNDNKLKGSDYYYIEYKPEFLFKGKKYNLRKSFIDLSGLGSSIIYDDKNILIFTFEMYSNPVAKKSNIVNFLGNTYILNKENMGVYEPISLDIDLILKDGIGIVNKFTKLEKVSYNKVKDEYTIVFSIQNLSNLGVNKILYNKNPITYTYVLSARKTKDNNIHPFILKKFYEKRKNDSKILSKDNAYGLNWYYLEEDKSVSDKKK